jgi:hypothetical protein
MEGLHTYNNASYAAVIKPATLLVANAFALDDTKRKSRSKEFDFISIMFRGKPREEIIHGHKVSVQYLP